MAYETICVEMPCEQAAELYRFCSEHRLTLDELVDQFLRWCIREPDAFREWYEKCEKEEPCPMNRTPGMRIYHGTAESVSTAAAPTRKADWPACVWTI